MPKYSKPKPKSTAKSRSMTPWLIGAGVLFVLLIVFAVFMNSRSSAVNVAERNVDAAWLQRTTLGNPDATVTVQAWEDFLCPACQQWTSTIEPRLEEEYVNTGLVKLEYHQFPLNIHAPGAQMSAMAAECAADQGAFWTYHDRLFQEAARSGQAGTTLDRLVSYADDLNLDVADFRSCMTTQKHRTTVDASVNQAVALGLNSTPSILINGKLMEEPFNYSALSSEIDRLLEAAGVTP